MSRLVACYLGLGSNLGDRQSNLEKAAGLIAQSIGSVIAQSATYESEPWGTFEGETYPYLNAALKCETLLPPGEVLTAISKIEIELGRKRTDKNAPRPIDIDILFYDHQIIQHDDLVVPHPFLQQRNFVLLPLMDIDAEFIHPALGLSIRELLHQSQDCSHVHRIG